MFNLGKKSKHADNKAKLERKLYLARENPEPIFDLSECGLKSVPSGVYSLCKVFRKESLYLQENQLTSLSSGGQLSELSHLTVLDLGNNQFTVLTEDIGHLVNLKELHLNKNRLKSLPEGICKLHKLSLLDVSHNNLKSLPSCIGCLKCLQVLSLEGNCCLTHLPQSLCHITNTLRSIKLDVDKVTHPPPEVTTKGTQEILKYLCKEHGCEYLPPAIDENISAAISNTSSPLAHLERHDCDILDVFRRLEMKKNEKLQEVLAVEKEIQEQKGNEFIIQSQNKQEKDKLLEDLLQQQSKLEGEVERFQNQKEAERNKLIDHLVKVEDYAGQMINELVAANNKFRASNQWLKEEDKLQQEMLCSQQSSQAIQRKEILSKMENILVEECAKIQEYERMKSEVVKNSLDREIEWDQHVCARVFEREAHQNAIVAAVAADEVAQKAAVGVLLERGDLYTQQLVAQVSLVEQQLAVLTSLEIKRKKLNTEQQLNALAVKRVTLSNLLVDLLSQQEERRHQLLATLNKMEQCNEDTYGHKNTDFWLRQYQKLLDMRPKAITSAQKDLDPALVHELVLGGVIHCLPFVAQCDLNNISSSQLTKVGLTSKEEQRAVISAVTKYHAQRTTRTTQTIASAPALPEKEIQNECVVCMESEVGLTSKEKQRALINAVTKYHAQRTTQEIASAPPLPEEEIQNECVVCMESECQGVFVPCGHLCTCMVCAVQLVDCPLCRSKIDRIIRVILL